MVSESVCSFFCQKSVKFSREYLFNNCSWFFFVIWKFLSLRLNSYVHKVLSLSQNIAVILLLYCCYFGPALKGNWSVIFIYSISYPAVVLLYQKRNFTAVTLDKLFTEKEMCVYRALIGNNWITLLAELWLEICNRIPSFPCC